MFLYEMKVRVNKYSTVQWLYFEYVHVFTLQYQMLFLPAHATEHILTAITCDPLTDASNISSLLLYNACMYVDDADADADGGDADGGDGGGGGGGDGGGGYQPSLTSHWATNLPPPVHRWHHRQHLH